MGVKKLNKFIENHDLIKKHKNILDFIRDCKDEDFQCFNTRNRKFVIAVDVMLYAYKYKYSYGDIIFGFTKQIINFLNNKIIPVYIFDGMPPEEKQYTINKRKKKRLQMKKKIETLELELKNNSHSNEKVYEINTKINKLNKCCVKIEIDDIKKMVMLFKVFNVPYMKAIGEADVLIANLYKSNSINACLSEDMDIIVYGCDKMIKICNRQIYEYDINYILKNLKITKSQFIDMCILFGCDYIRPISNKSPKQIFDEIKEKNIIDIISENCNKEQKTNYISSYNKIKKLYLNNIHTNKFINFKITNSIDLNELINFLKNKSTKFNKNYIKKIKYNLVYINNMIKNNKFY